MVPKGCARIAAIAGTVADTGMPVPLWPIAWLCRDSTYSDSTGATRTLANVLNYVELEQ